MKKNFLLIIFLVIFTFSIRLIGLNWDQGQHLHPDERFVTMVISELKLPSSIFDYFSTSTSSFNPSNHGFDFFAYGTFPLLLTKFVANIFNLADYQSIFFVGRLFSILFDTGIVLVIFLIGQYLFHAFKPAYFSALAYSLAFLPIQQSHFFTVDSFAAFFFILTVYFSLRRHLFLSGLFFGLTLSCKVSLIITAPIFLFIFGFRSTIFLGLITAITFRLFEPYAFVSLLSPNPLFLSSIKTAHKMITGEVSYPPNVQWLSTLPLIHPLINLFIGLNPANFVLLFFAIFRRPQFSRRFLFLTGLILVVFLYQGIFLAKYLRYFYPIYPILCLVIGRRFTQIKSYLFSFLFLIFFISIFLYPHPRVEASDWLCQYITADKKLTTESWDDPLPLPTSICQAKNYSFLTLDLFDPDTPQKWIKTNSQLDQADYLILSSNRLWGSIPKAANLYPQTSYFYHQLFTNQTQFTLSRHFFSYPGIRLPLSSCFLIGPSLYPGASRWFDSFPCSRPGIYFRDNFFEESFSVYDHPEVIIFSRQSK